MSGTHACIKSFVSFRSERQRTMKPNGTTAVTHEPGEPEMNTGTDWAAIKALPDEEGLCRRTGRPGNSPPPLPSGTAAELAMQGLTQLVNVKKLRERIGLTQEAFAATYRNPVGTLRDWEQSRKNPDAPARAYLMIIERRLTDQTPEGLRCLPKPSHF